jgi:hypothetical protein
MMKVKKRKNRLIASDFVDYINMSILKKTKDHILKFFWGGKSVPIGLFELSQYFRHYRSIDFKFEKRDNLIIAISTDFRYGSIVTSGKNEKDLDKNIKDAILTSFEIPSSYSEEVKIYKEGEAQERYALV